MASANQEEPSDSDISTGMFVPDTTQQNQEQQQTPLAEQNEYITDVHLQDNTGQTGHNIVLAGTVQQQNTYEQIGINHQDFQKEEQKDGNKLIITIINNLLSLLGYIPRYYTSKFSTTLQFHTVHVHVH